MTPTLPKFWPEKKKEYETCTQCGGLGLTPNHPHIEAKRCLACNGAKKVPRNDYKMWNACHDEFTALYLKGELVAKSELPTEDELEEIIANTSTTTRIGHSTLSKAIATAISKRMRGER